jgi:hypothetical protein
MCLVPLVQLCMHVYAYKNKYEAKSVHVVVNVSKKIALETVHLGVNISKQMSYRKWVFPFVKLCMHVYT